MVPSRLEHLLRVYRLLAKAGDEGVAQGATGAGGAGRVKGRAEKDGRDDGEGIREEDIEGGRLLSVMHMVRLLSKRARLSKNAA